MEASLVGIGIKEMGTPIEVRGEEDG